MLKRKIKKPISPYSYVGIMYDKIKKEHVPIEKHEPKKEINNFTIHEVLSVVANNWGITEEQVIDKVKKQTFVDARYTYFAALRLKYDLDLSTIGNLANRRHHTTVIHGLRTFYNRYHRIDNFRMIADRIFQTLGMEYVGKKLTQSLEPFENKNKKNMK